MSALFDLGGKPALMIGGSQGIGESAAPYLARPERRDRARGPVSDFRPGQLRHRSGRDGRQGLDGGPPRPSGRYVRAPGGGCVRRAALGALSSFGMKPAPHERVGL